MSNIRILNNVSLYNSITSISSIRTPEVQGFNSKLTIKPDPSTNDDRYLIIEPTGPSDIHIRAGGISDQSSANLRFGGEYNHVEVSDSGHYIKHNTGMKDSSGNWHTNYDGYGAPWVFQTEEIVDGLEYKHSFYLPTSAHIGQDNGTATWHGTLNFTGNLNVAGSATFHNTEYTTTSSISVTNNGTGPALVVNQTGEQAIAAFYDDNSIAFYIDGKTGTGGYVGIGTSTPNEKLTVVGNISSTGTLYVSGITNCDPLGTGNITLQTCGGGTNQLVLSSNGQLITPNNLIVNGSVYATGGIVGASTIQKIVSSFGNGADTVYEVVHNLDTEDVVVSIIDTATKEVVYPSVVNYSLSSIKVEFSEAPALTAYKAVIIG